MAATKATLSTTELLEQILLHLPLRSVLRVQLVSHSWHATIHTSIKLQQALFLRPIPAVKTTKQQRPMQTVTLNDPCASVLATPTPSSLVNDILGLEGSAAGICTLSNPIPTALLEKKGTWHSMHLTQPPTPSSSSLLIGNFIALTATEATGLPRDRFIPSATPSVLESNHCTTRTLHGSFSRLGAVQLECASGLTIGTAAEAIAQLAEKFGRAEHKGRRLRFFWGSQVHANLMVDLLMEIAECVEEDVRRMRSSSGGARG
ncbi:hypothetical protein CLAFUW4_09610 [Fulvia fulva]|uniref:F-box domain-containing protein n=1 Tax=Passalora fulva TaxID=5499 RepID=A0A9Q8UTN2_PASFU|nr:uncharacterized protein CLAFUR5_09704 [Fulvia fulva]KAK4614073.1 hypothetical protein CLAFUR4_09615 [Fulvia fulva]KAK4614567.1 hypothetical protein CLAFUR0_09606 [Fulvia fulva]UJO21985.1 hypothetical protein CLAFUR5_09704 [Fulvia fulva]WPV20089.1 hypothetical protein CLAFUW4_09610 [Fulvia fulva]WPV35547.1 hypothetical protein CLAFUW7_09611 [Fulvia fulva]